MEILTFILIMLIGLFAGFINVIVGSGSSVGVPFLIFLGLPPVNAIGTNRFAMIFNGLSAVHGYHRKKKIRWNDAIYLSFFATFGGVLGALLVLDSKPEFLKQLIALILIAECIFILFIKKNVGIVEREIIKGKKKFIYTAVFGFVLGLYGGFIGMAMTSMVIFFLVSVLGYRFIESAAISKVLGVSVSLLATMIFLVNLKVEIVIGIVLAISYILGAYLGVHSAVEMGNKKIRYLFVVIVFLTAVKLLFF